MGDPVGRPEEESAKLGATPPTMAQPAVLPGAPQPSWNPFNPNFYQGFWPMTHPTPVPEASTGPIGAPMQQPKLECPRCPRWYGEGGIGCLRCSDEQWPAARPGELDQS